MQEPLFGARKSVSDNFLFSRVTPLIQKINGLSDQLQNKDLEEFVIKETDCLTILDQLEAYSSSITQNLVGKLKFTPTTAKLTHLQADATS